NACRDQERLLEEWIVKFALLRTQRLDFNTAVQAAGTLPFSFLVGNSECNRAVFDYRFALKTIRKNLFEMRCTNDTERQRKQKTSDQALACLTELKSWIWMTLNARVRSMDGHLKTFTTHVTPDPPPPSFPEASKARTPWLSVCLAYLKSYEELSKSVSDASQSEHSVAYYKQGLIMLADDWSTRLNEAALERSSPTSRRSSQRSSGGLVPSGSGSSGGGVSSEGSLDSLGERAQNLIHISEASHWGNATL
ncbi:hypothetical protein C0991_006931, partial [Blastosporella zonata]